MSQHPLSHSGKTLNCPRVNGSLIFDSHHSIILQVIKFVAVELVLNLLEVGTFIHLMPFGFFRFLAMIAYMSYYSLVFVTVVGDRLELGSILAVVSSEVVIEEVEELVLAVRVINPFVVAVIVVDVLCFACRLGNQMANQVKISLSNLDHFERRVSARVSLEFYSEFSVLIAQIGLKSPDWHNMQRLNSTGMDCLLDL